MTELRDVEQELDRFRARLLAAGLFVLFGFGLLIARLFYAAGGQVRRAVAPRPRTTASPCVPIVPNRGLIVDRNGVVLANNYSAYTLEITPSQVPTTWRPRSTQLAEVRRDPRRATAAASSAC